MTNPYEQTPPVPTQPAWGQPAVTGWSSPPAAQGWGPVVPAPQLVPTAALASPWLRLAAALINGVLMVVTLFVGYLVWTLVLWNQGTNPGKKMLGMRIVQASTGRTCTFGEMLVRNFVFGSLVIGLISGFTLGIGGLVDLFMIFGERRQRLIDKMAGTLVVVG